MDMQPRKAGKFLKLKGGWASLLPLALISTSVGAFIVGVSVYAVDTLEPPTALFPDQGSLPSIGGVGAGNLLEVLRGSKPPAALVAGASYAKWADWKGFTVIGGRLGLGQIVGTDPVVEYPLDIQVDYDSPNNMPKDSSDSAILHNTAEIRLAGRDQTNGNGSRIWTGLKLDRMTGNPPPAAFTEKWFIGMDNATDNLIIRANGSTNVVNIDPAKGAACFGAMYVGKTDTKYDGRVNQAAGAGGYIEANKACSAKHPNSHMCTAEEVLRTITCSSSSSEIPWSGVGWVSKGPPGFDQVLSNDCKGWTVNTDVLQAGYWILNLKGGYTMLATCDSKKAFLCCK